MPIIGADEPYVPFLDFNADIILKMIGLLQLSPVIVPAMVLCMSRMIIMHIDKRMKVRFLVGVGYVGAGHSNIRLQQENTPSFL